MTADQRKASDPALSAWVAANAGTGKTKVLTDRVIRLLLAGASPGRIVCITYTKAAAAEMSRRVQETLASWTVADDAKLTETLIGLLGHAPNSETLARARQLFAAVLESGDGLKIHTIHAFCQSILRRFPLEAGVAPHFRVIDARTQAELLAEARQRLLERRTLAQDPALADAVRHIASSLSEYGLASLSRELMQGRLKITHRADTPEVLRREVYTRLGVPFDATEESILTDVFALEAAQKLELRRAVAVLAHGSKTERNVAQPLGRWLEDGVRTAARFEACKKALLTQKGTPIARLMVKTTAEHYPDFEPLLRDEQERFLEADARLNAYALARNSAALLVYAGRLFAQYDALRESRAYLDFDDLIALTSRLLARPDVSPWIFYKLEGGIDHLLIDEAQDTSPAQWDIIVPLITEFFHADRASTMPRTLFVVGDEKQSIYSFQGARPGAFHDARTRFTEILRESNNAFLSVALTHSFRSSPPVLETVDAIFAREVAREGLGQGSVTVVHQASREGHAGCIELWPLVPKSTREESIAWEPFALAQTEKSAVEILARRIAARVRGWLDEGRVLPSRGTAVGPGDILILVRRRGEIAESISRMLKRYGVPVAGADRLRLGEHIAIQDLIALAEFLLLPDDDMALAIVLRSPICDMSEEDLFTLAHGRGEASLWQRLRASMHGEIIAMLEALLARVDFIPPHAVFVEALDRHGMRMRLAQRLGTEIFDPLSEFLALALAFEATHAPTMQGFLHWFAAHDSEIKRDMEQGGGEVRIMTVHGAKGLQAPIVFLPDTSFKVSSRDNLLWDGDLPLWRRGAHTPLDQELYDARKAEELNESSRLLYVALTRAEDELYICGAQPGKAASGAWYELIAGGFPDTANSVEIAFPDGTHSVLRVCAEHQDVLRTIRASVERVAAEPAPPALLFPAPVETPLSRPLSPSRPVDDEATPSSPRDATVDSLRFRRGRLMHQLLQLLVDLPASVREDFGARWLVREDGTLGEAQRAEMLSAVLGVLSDSRFTALFAPGSVAEAPISGIVDGRAVAGRIDRLSVTPEAVWIVDYKSDRHVCDPDAIPDSYINQLLLYASLLRQLYPDRPVRAAVLWTALPALAEVALPTS